MITLHVVTSLDPGGMENGVCNIARGLAGRGVTTHVACLERRGAFAERLPEPGNVHILGKSGGFSIRAVWNLARLIRRLRADVLHTHNLGGLIYGALATLHGRTCPIVQGEHAQLAPWELAPRRLQQRHKLYRHCRAIHTVSQGQLDELVELGFPAGKIRSIANGVDTERFAPADRTVAKAALGIPADATVLGLVGRFGPFKRHDVLLSAFEKIAAEFPRAHLVFIGGGGSEENRIRSAVAASPVAARVHLAGFQQDPVPHYQALDLLVIPSVNEGMSNAALEAMSCGVPVLGNTGCGHEQIITNGRDGSIADIADAEKLTAELVTMLRAPERLVDTGRAARMTVGERFSLTAMLDAYEEIYRANARTR